MRQPTWGNTAILWASRGGHGDIEEIPFAGGDFVPDTADIEDQTPLVESCNWA